MPNEDQFSEALEGALDKKARHIVVIDLDGVCSFTDRFIVCDGTSTRHNQTISDGVAERLRSLGVRPLHIEGYAEGEWILMDYIDFVVHIFTARAREYYDLERLWRAGKRREIAQPA
jgi:ribosome-associated protein